MERGHQRSRSRSTQQSPSKGERPALLRMFSTLLNPSVCGGSALSCPSKGGPLHHAAHHDATPVLAAAGSLLVGAPHVVTCCMLHALSLTRHASHASCPARCFHATAGCVQTSATPAKPLRTWRTSRGRWWARPSAKLRDTLSTSHSGDTPPATLCTRPLHAACLHCIIIMR